MIGRMSAATVRAAQLGRSQLRVHDLPREPRHGARDVGPGTGQADVGGVDAESLHHVQEL